MAESGGEMSAKMDVVSVVVKVVSTVSSSDIVVTISLEYKIKPRYDFEEYCYINPYTEIPIGWSWLR